MRESSASPLVWCYVLIGLLLPFAAWPGASSATEPAAGSNLPVGDELCLQAEVAGGEGTVCARRDRFGLVWDLSVTDTEDDGRDVSGSIALALADARDPVATLRNDLGAGATTHASGSFHPRFGRAIGDLALTVCLDIRFFPDRCHTSSAAVPQLASRATPEQAARLEELVFEMPLDEFVATWADGDRSGVDADFDWSSDGCSAGPVAPAFEDFLDLACLRHDFAYRNLGQLGYDPTDAARQRADEQLANDARTVGRGDVSEGLTWALQRFAAPVFFGDELSDVWGVPEFLASWLRSDPSDGPTNGGG
jgi:hypothetical protein